MSTTIDSIASGNTSNTMPEFGRVNDVQKLFGIKRGILYRWIGDGKVKSVCLREPGNKQGVRLIHLQSVRDYINILVINDDSHTGNDFIGTIVIPALEQYTPDLLCIDPLLSYLGGDVLAVLADVISQWLWKQPFKFRI
jgi:hypothetical protein